MVIVYDRETCRLRYDRHFEIDVSRLHNLNIKSNEECFR